ncbi:MAG: NAD-dependent epimerase/dehydratase family protein, partial [Candidatus Moranbacteria bacterium]|nr:NAD-dependent epimerase/dehydratase family protein [Candidatus Moranbacteria bacterium]
MNLLVTGCCGFIGANFVKMILKERPDWKIVNLDLLTYAGNRANLQEDESLPNYFFFQGDICSPADVEKAAALLGERPDAVVNFAAESHVDNSIKNPGIFVQTNVQGTLTLLKYAHDNKCRFLQVSTDEVYG